MKAAYWICLSLCRLEGRQRNSRPIRALEAFQIGRTTESFLIQELQFADAAILTETGLGHLIRQRVAPPPPRARKAA